MWKNLEKYYGFMCLKEIIVKECVVQIYFEKKKSSNECWDKLNNWVTF